VYSDFSLAMEWRPITCLIRGQSGDPEELAKFCRTSESLLAVDLLRNAKRLGLSMDHQEFQRQAYMAAHGEIEGISLRGASTASMIDLSMRQELQGVTFDAELDRLKDDYRRRAVSQELAAIARSVAGSPIERVQRRIEQAAEQLASGKPAKNDDNFNELFAEIAEQRRHPDAMPGVPSGIRALDEMIGGLRGGHLVIVGARTGVGKTAIGLQIAGDAALAAGKPAYVVSCEMSRSDVLLRVLSQRSGVPESRILRGGTPSDMRKLKEATSECEGVMWVSERVGGTFDDFLGGLREALESGVSCVLIDYIQLLNLDSDKPRHLAVAQVSAQLKRLALHYRVPIVALSQLNRESDKERRTPTVADLKDSGSIEQDADVIVLVHREESDATIYVAKNRRGSQGAVRMVYDGPTYTFYERVA